jgi:hypothetical protein
MDSNGIMKTYRAIAWKMGVGDREGKSMTIKMR